MKLKQLLNYINKQMAAGTLNDDSLVTFSLPTSFLKMHNTVELGSCFPLNLKVGTMEPLNSPEFPNNEPSELNFEPTVKQYRRIMREDFNKFIPIEV